MLKRIITLLLSPLLTVTLGSVALAAITVSVSPTTDTVLPGSIRSVYSNTQGVANSAVSWSASGGTIQTSTGYYATWKAPNISGNYTIKATSSEDGSKSATATFTVIDTAQIRVTNIPMQATVFKQQPVSIQSILWGSTNTDVTWAISGGTLTGNGREVIFSADTAGTYTVSATSNADPSKTATTFIVATQNTYPGTSTANKTQPVDCTPTGSGSTYEVTTEANMDDVPWSALGAGDTVRIHPGTYHKQILISTSGKESQPIRICGVPDGSGNLPELNGANATAQKGAAYSSGYSLQGYAGIIIHDKNVTYYGGAVYPKNIIIEGLKISGYHPNNNFTNIFTGLPAAYVNGAAPIRTQHGSNITIRGNELTGNGNGLFTMANNSIESLTTRNLLVEGNYFHNNGVSGSYLEHQSYLQSFGLVVQGNNYGTNAVGSLGGQLKTRAVQQFIRYNYFDPAMRMIDVVEEQDSPGLVFPWYGLDPNELVNTSMTDVIANYEAYQNVFIYGNILNNTGPNVTGWMVHCAADTGSQDANYGGIVFFFNNTVNISIPSNVLYRSGLFDFGPYQTIVSSHTIWPTARLTNNAIYIDSSVSPSPTFFFFNRYQSDRIVLDKNWISTTWGTGDSSGGDGTGISIAAGDGGVSSTWQGGTISTQVSGVSNLITGNAVTFDITTYSPLSGSPLIGASTSLPDAISTLPPLMKYNISTQTMERRASIQDIGAIDSSSPSPLIKKISLQ